MMKRSLVLVFVLYLLVGCGGEAAPGEGPPPCSSVGETWTRPADGMEMVCVPAGEFLMGSTDEDIDMVMLGCDGCLRVGFDRAEQPQHTVTLDAFWIDRTEVTNAQYRQCVEAGDCQQPGCWDWEGVNAPDQPVICVSWDDAQAYAAWVGGRLPTEAEWEKAARGTDGRIYPWGDSFDGRLVNLCDANCEKNWKDSTDSTVDDGHDYTAPVGSYPGGASPYGVLDMAGNVWEWVADWYDEGYYSESPSSNPQGPSSGDFRVLRGGSWFSNQGSARCAFRGWYPPFFFYDLVGFRVVVAPATSEL